VSLYLRGKVTPVATYVSGRGKREPTLRTPFRLRKVKCHWWQKCRFPAANDRKGIHSESLLCLVCSVMKHAVLIAPQAEDALDLPLIMQRVTANSSRPRYTFMVLDLISRLARENGSVGPYIRDGEALVPIREWLSLAISPIASHHHRRIAMMEHVRAGLAATGRLCGDQALAEQTVDEEVRDRVRTSGMTAVSRAVSELVKAGLVTRHYQGFCVDHENRGAKRLAVYTISPAVRDVLRTGQGNTGRIAAAASVTAPARRRAAPIADDLFSGTMFAPAR